MKAEEPYVGKPLVRFREGRGGNQAELSPSTRPRHSKPYTRRGQAHLPDPYLAMFSANCQAQILADYCCRKPTVDSGLHYAPNLRAMNLVGGP
jgi:hypothetical protein